MGQNILIAGAAGGGSLVADFVSRTSGPIKEANIWAAARLEEQVRSLSKPGVNAIQTDLSDEADVRNAIFGNEIDIVVNTSSSFDSRVVSHIIKALGQRRRVSGKETYFIQSSVSTVFATEAGWPSGEVKDTDPLFEKEKQIGGAHPVRETNILLTELAKAQGVTSINIAVPMVYGRGMGEWRKLSVSIPAYIRTSIRQKIVHKWDKDGSPPASHIADLTALYALIIEKILQGESIPSDEKGYYFAIAHRVPLWDIMQRLAERLYARGLIQEQEVQIWPDDETAAESLGFPLKYVRAMCTSSGEMVPVNAYRLGWRPEWDQKRFLESIDDEIQAVLELDTVSSTLFEPLIGSGK